MDNVELLFLPGQKRWFLTTPDMAYLVPTQSAAEVLASFVPLRLDDRMYEHTLAGSIDVIDVGTGTCRIRLDRPGHAEHGDEHVLRPHAVSLAVVEWIDGTTTDAWLSCEAAFTVEGATRVGLRFFLPLLPGLIEKVLTFEVNGELLAESPLARGKPSEFWLDLPAGSNQVHRVDIVASYAEPVSETGDIRALGAVLMAVNLDGQTWAEYARAA